MKPIHVGIYKLVYLPTKQFYIGATRNSYKRWHSHKSFFSNNRNHKSLQKLYNLTHDIKDWKMTMLEECTVKSLNKTEQVWLTKYQKNPKCLNKNFKAFGGRRNIKSPDIGREHLAMSMLGKNTKKGIRRPNNLTFVAPDGTEYPHIISVKRFAEDHGLGQVLLNHLANGVLSSYEGWTRKDLKLPFAANVLDYWSRERMLQNYPEYVIIGPDKTEYRTFVLSAFEQKHECKVLTEMILRTGVKSHTRGLDSQGRGYRLQNVPYFKIHYKGKVYDNIISIGKWGHHIGLTTKQMQYYLRVANKKRKVTKRSVIFSIEKIVP